MALLLLKPGTSFGALFSGTSQQRGPALLKMGAGARMAGMGDSFVAVADDPSAAFWNPSGMNQIATAEALFSHRESVGGIAQEALAYARPVWWNGARRTWGASVSYLSGPSFDVVELGNTTGQARPWDGAFGISYSQSLGMVEAGSTVKVVRQEIYGESAQAYALDVGFLGRGLKDRFTWGTSLANLGTRMEWGSSSTGLPTVFRMGAAYRFYPETVGGAWLTSAELDAPVDDSPIARFGVEYSKWIQNHLRPALRFGYRTRAGGSGMDGFSVGGGLVWNSLRFEYAFVPNSGAGDAHQVEVGVRFGGRLAEEERRDLLMAQARQDYSVGRLVQGQSTVAEILALSPRYAPAKRLARDIQSRFTESIDPETLFTLGYHAYQEKRLDTAADFFRRLLVVKPDHGEGRSWLEKTEKELAAQREATIRESVARVQRREIEAGAARAEIHMKNGRWAQALAEWRKIEEMDPHHSRALAAQGECRDALYQEGVKAQAAGNPSGALAAFRNARQGLRSYKDTSTLIQKLEEAERTKRVTEAKQAYTEGVRAYGEGRLEEARTLLRSALERTPDDEMVQKALESVEQELRHQTPGHP